MNAIGNGDHATVVREIIRLTWLDRPPLGTFIAVGDNQDRRKEALASPGPFPVLIHPSAIVSESATIEGGSVIMAGAIIQPHAHIGWHVIVNTGATVDHHCEVGDFAHIAPGAHLCGRVLVGEGALVGVGVGIEPGTIIPAWSIVKRIPYAIEPVSGHAAA